MPGIFSSGMDVDRHAAAVVAHLAAAVGMQDHVDLLRMPGQRLVHRVVDDLLRQVIGARGVGVHAGAALDRLQAGEDFDVGGVVARIHGAERGSGADRRRAGWRRGAGDASLRSGAGGASGRCRTRRRGDVAFSRPHNADVRR
jgi:hypothetical protein